MCVCVCLSVHVCVCLSVHACVCLSVSVCVCARTRVCVIVSIWIYKYGIIISLVIDTDLATQVDALVKKLNETASTLSYSVGEVNTSCYDIVNTQNQFVNDKVRACNYYKWS